MKVELTKLTINYIQSGDKEPLILLHGNGENCHIFDEIMNCLGEDYHVYAIDSRGHGRSKMKIKEYHYQDMADDLYEFIVKLNINKPIIFGYSDGAIVALLLELAHKGIAKQLILAGLNVSPDGVEDFYVNASIKDSLKSTDENERKLAALMVNEPNINQEELKSIDCDVNLLYGDSDMIKIDHQIYINQSIKNSSLRIINNADHGSYIYNNPGLAKIIKEEIKKS